MSSDTMAYKQPLYQRYPDSDDDYMSYSQGVSSRPVKKGGLCCLFSMCSREQVEDNYLPGECRKEACWDPN